MRLEPVPRDQPDPALRATLDAFIKGTLEFNPLVFEPTSVLRCLKLATSSVRMLRSCPSLI